MIPLTMLFLVLALPFLGCVPTRALAGSDRGSTSNYLPDVPYYLWSSILYNICCVRESHRTYRIRYMRKYVSTDEDPYTYGTIRRPSGTRRRSAEAIPKRSGPSRQSLNKFAEIRLDTDRITYTYRDSACTEDGSHRTITPFARQVVLCGSGRASKPGPGSGLSGSGLRKIPSPTHLAGSGLGRVGLGLRPGLEQCIFQKVVPDTQSIHFLLALAAVLLLGFIGQCGLIGRARQLRKEEITMQRRLHEL
ncbi:hypothetical protein K438DRAFT_1761157 [Mycena galopus ATCC 62051]|nr:hypothetical protein K438DRAFT_1761157 [Mycena galopus ATCC 62051]